MSYPKTVKMFEAWAKAMVRGAQVDKPNYSSAATGSTKTSRGGRTKRTSRRRTRRKKKRMVKNG